MLQQDLHFPTDKTICDLHDIEQAKILFRLANAQYKKAQEFYTIEKGYMGEQVGIKQDISKLYKFLAVMEADQQRVSAMHDRRREILEAALNDLNS